LRLLLLAERLVPSGVTSYTENLVRALVARHAVLLVAPGGPAAERVGAAAGKSVIIPGISRWGLVLRPGRSRLLAEAQGFRPDLVHALSGHAAKAAAAVSNELGLPEVITSHHFVRGPGGLALHRRVRRIMAVSQALRENLVNTGKIPRELVEVVPNGLNVKAYPVRVEPEPLPGEPPRLPVIGYFGRLTRRKGPELLVRAAADLGRRGVDAEFLIAGEGPERQRLERLAVELGVRQRITFREAPLPARDLLPTFDVFVSPSRQETMGMTVIEAMACGVPVVATAVGGIFTVIRDGENGLLAPPEDFAALADRICDLLKDPARRHEIAAAGRETVEREFSLQRMMAATELTYYGALEKSDSEALRD
jgi:glycosyltransferase involved in cell wall biosynthesis